MFKDLSLSGQIRLILMLLRGLFYSIRARRIVLLGKGARILNIRHMQGRGLIKLEDFALLQCGPGYFRVGKGFSLGSFSQVRPNSLYKKSVPSHVEFGDGTTFGAYCYIGGNNIRFGLNNKIGMNVKVLAENHDKEGSGTSSLGIVVGQQNWIGASVCVLDGSVIGNNNSIGAGTIISKKTKLCDSKVIINEKKYRYI